MCLNQILFDEQIALMRCHAASDPAHIRRHRGHMADASRLVAAYPYPHRPYDPWTSARMDMPRLAQTTKTGTR